MTSAQIEEWCRGLSVGDKVAIHDLTDVMGLSPEFVAGKFLSLGTVTAVTIAILQVSPDHKDILLGYWHKYFTFWRDNTLSMRGCCIRPTEGK